MKVFEKLEVSQVELRNRTIIRVGDSYGDGIVLSITTGEELRKYTGSSEWVDDEGIKKEVSFMLDIVDGDEGWSIYLDDEGNELMDL